MKTAAILLLLLTGASAATPTPYALYAAGDYAGAMKAGESQNDAAGLLVAARTALADATTREKPCMECLKHAEELSRRAITADPKAPEAHTYLAVSLGYQARILGPIVARLHDYPGEARKELDAALADDPQNVWALAALGGWNVEIVRAGGATLANWFYGATIEGGLGDFAAAFKTAPDNMVLRYQYALSLSGYDPSRFRAEILDALARAGRAVPATAYERMVQTRAADLRELLARGDRAAFDAHVRKYQGYP
jgi:tetratricopeptide (TPR) repeat protein